MSTDKHRLFIGIPLDDSIRDCLKTRADELKHSLHSKHINWLPKENYHVTLIFLGSIETEKLPVIKASLAAIEQNLVPFSIEIDEVILFPNPRHPKIIAAKVHLTEALGKLHALLHLEMSNLGFKLDERPYLPHITLARIKYHDTNETQRNLEIPYAAKPQLQLITQLALFKSLQTEEGTQYEIISRENCLSR